MENPHPRGTLSRMGNLGGIDLMRSWQLLGVVSASFLISCAGTWAGKPPPCPPFTEPAVDDIEDMIDNQSHTALLLWIGDIDRYCDGIKAMRE